MPEKLEIILVRHGQSTANASGVWQGQMDFPLSDEGRRQARLAGEALSGGRLDAVYSSPLSRALETARIIAREAGYRDEIRPLDGLLERGGGWLEGTTHEERIAKNPALVEKFLSLPEEERWMLVGAETDEQVLERFSRALSEIEARHAGGGSVLVVSHGGAMRAYLRDRFGPEVLPGDRRAANASITRLALGPDGQATLLELASTEHLSPADETYPTSE